MKKKMIDPAAWLAEHDPGAALADSFSFSRDVLQLGADELVNHGGDLSRALAGCDCRAEIVLAWLAARAAEAEDGRAGVGDVMLAARIVGRLNALTCA